MIVTLNLCEELYRGWRMRPGIDLESLMDKLDKTHPLDTLLDVIYAYAMPFLIKLLLLALMRGSL
jgi:hypothetical protein